MYYLEQKDGPWCQGGTSTGGGSGTGGKSDKDAKRPGGSKGSEQSPDDARNATA